MRRKAHTHERTGAVHDSGKCRQLGFPPNGLPPGSAQRMNPAALISQLSNLAALLQLTPGLIADRGQSLIPRRPWVLHLQVAAAGRHLLGPAERGTEVLLFRSSFMHLYCKIRNKQTARINHSCICRPGTWRAGQSIGSALQVQTCASKQPYTRSAWRRTCAPCLCYANSSIYTA